MRSMGPHRSPRLFRLLFSGRIVSPHLWRVLLQLKSCTLLSRKPAQAEAKWSYFRPPKRAAVQRLWNGTAKEHCYKGTWRPAARSEGPGGAGAVLAAVRPLGSVRSWVGLGAGCGPRGPTWPLGRRWVRWPVTPTGATGAGSSAPPPCRRLPAGGCRGPLLSSLGCWGARWTPPRLQVPSNVIVMSSEEHIQLGWVVRWVLSTPPGHPTAGRCVRVVPVLPLLLCTHPTRARPSVGGQSPTPAPRQLPWSPPRGWCSRVR
jgi:hypothetical protein